MCMYRAAIDMPYLETRYGRMTLVQDAETLGAADLLPHQQAAWQHQREYVAKNSVFYQELWNGRPLPQNLHDIIEMTLSDNAQLRLSQANHPPLGNYLASTRAKVTRLHRTSGTTGQAIFRSAAAATLR